MKLIRNCLRVEKTNIFLVKFVTYEAICLQLIVDAHKQQQRLLTNILSKIVD